MLWHVVLSKNGPVIISIPSPKLFWSIATLPQEVESIAFLLNPHRLCDWSNRYSTVETMPDDLQGWIMKRIQLTFSLSYSLFLLHMAFALENEPPYCEEAQTN